MFSIYKVSSLAVAAVVSASVLMSANAIAETPGSAQAQETPMVLAAGDTISRSEARSMVRDQLKANGNRKLRVGSTSRSHGAWIVTVVTSQGTPAYKVRIDAVSGEMSRA